MYQPTKDGSCVTVANVRLESSSLLANSLARLGSGPDVIIGRSATLGRRTAFADATEAPDRSSTNSSIGNILRVSDPRALLGIRMDVLCADCVQQCVESVLSQQQRRA
jgi:hypothetical protein